MKKISVLPLAGLLLLTALIVPVLAETPEKTDGFVCPVLGGKAGMNGNSQSIFGIADGYYSVRGGDVTVPKHATNSGFPSVSGSFGAPGDEGYTAIWDYDNAP